MMKKTSSLTFLPSCFSSFSKYCIFDLYFSFFYEAARKLADVAAVSSNLFKTYKPCEIIEVSIHVDDPKLKYLGLLAYFENDQGEKVGSWVLPSEVAASGGETTFNTCNNGAAVMHANVRYKNVKKLKIFSCFG